MGRLGEIWRRVGMLLRREKFDRELDEEMRLHRELKEREFVANGVEESEATYAARRQFGSAAVLRERGREAWGWRWLEDSVQDVRFGARMLRKNRGFTVVAVLTLALGIGASTTIFSVIEAVLLRPLPYKDPGRLAVLTDTEDPEYGAFLYQDLQACRSQSTAFQDIAIYYRDTGFSRVKLTGNGEPEFAQVAFVSANFFPLMEVSPLLGRQFTAEEEARQERVIVLSYGLWLRRFGASLDVIGKMLQVNGADSQIVGVMPANFQFPARDQQFWAPLTTNPWWGDPSTTNIDPRHTRLFYDRWQAVGRLKTGVILEQAQAETNAIYARLKTSDEHAERAGGMRVVPLRPNVGENTRLALFALFGAVASLLLMACSNVANLVLARGAARGREIAVRMALGAGRGRLTRQLFIESALLALFSGCLGVAAAALGVRLLIAFGPTDIPRLGEAGVNPGVLVFAFGVTLCSTILFGFAPGLKISLSDPMKGLKSGGRGASASLSLTRVRGALVVAEFALAVVLLASAGLLVRSFLAVEAVDLGFQPEHALTMHVAPTGSTPAARAAFYQAVLARTHAIPDVEGAGVIDALFELGSLSNLSLREIEGRGSEQRETAGPLTWNVIDGDYLQAMGARLATGRYFSERDAPDAPLVAIIDEAMAKRYWPGQNAVGKRFKGGDPRGHNDDWITVVGVVNDMRRTGLERNAIPHVYLWFGQSDEGRNTGDLVVRTKGDPRMTAGTLRAIVREIDPSAVLSSVNTLDQRLSEQLSPRRFQTWLLGVFSAMALVLASIGIFGVMRYAVEQRTHEIGVRMALGAKQSDVMRLIVGQGGRLVLLGVVIGTAAALALTRLITSLLFQVDSADPPTFVFTVLVLTLVALAACYGPARRAMRVDPMEALKYE